MLNMVNLMGHLVADPEVYEFRKEDGTAGLLSRYRIAVHSDRKEGEAVFIQVKSFGASAAFVRDYVKKGDLLVVSGRIAVEPYEKDGVRMYSTLVYANRNYLARKKEGDKAEGYKNRTLQPGKDRTGGGEGIKEQEAAAGLPEYEGMPDIPDISEPWDFPELP